MSMVAAPISAWISTAAQKYAVHPPMNIIILETPEKQERRNTIGKFHFASQHTHIFVKQ